GKSDGDAAGAGSDVGDEETGAVVFVGAASAKLAKGETVESDFDEVFGFGARNENVGSHFEGEAPKFLLAGEMLDGYAGNAAFEEILVGVCFFASEFGFGMRINIGAFALCGVKKKEFGSKCAGGDVRCAELRDAVFEGGAEVHSLVLAL